MGKCWAVCVPADKQNTREHFIPCFFVRRMLHLQMRRRKWRHTNINEWQSGKMARHDWVTLLSKICANAASQNSIPPKCKEGKKDFPNSLTLYTLLHQFTSGTLATGKLGGTSSTKTHQEQLSLWRGEMAYVLSLFLQRGAKCRVVTAFSPTQNGISNTVLRRHKKLGPTTDLFIQKQTPGKKRLKNLIFFW